MPGVARGVAINGTCVLVKVLASQPAWWERETTQAIGQQHTSPLRAGCEARRREVALIFGCGKGLVRYGPGASEVDGRLRAGGPQGL